MFIDSLSGSVKDAPAFRWFWLDDINPLSGHRKRRRIHAPNHAMELLHRRIIIYIRRLKVNRISSTGARPGNSPLKNVMRHKRLDGSGFRRFFFLVDISGAYGSVDPDKLVGAIIKHDIGLEGREQFVRDFLDQHCLSQKEGGVIVGAPASPDLFNFYCEVLLDPEIRELCNRYGLTYTRYLDDLTFSSDRVIGRKKRQALCRAIEKVGFRLNSRKAQVLDLTKGPITVNGVGITLEGRYFLPRHALRELCGLMHLARTGRPVNLNLIHGKMGVFKALTNPQQLNSTERRVLNMYRELKRLERKF